GNPGGNSDPHTGFLQRIDAGRVRVDFFARLDVADVLGVDAAACHPGTARDHDVFHGWTAAWKSGRCARAADRPGCSQSRQPASAGDGGGRDAAVGRRRLYREFHSAVGALELRSISRRGNRARLDRGLRLVRPAPREAADPAGPYMAAQMSAASRTARYRFSTGAVIRAGSRSSTWAPKRPMRASTASRSATRS